MKRVVLATMVFFLLGGLAIAKDYEVTKTAGDYRLVVSIDKNPPVTGDNNLSVSVKDGAGADVTNAKVSVEYSMPAMPGMPPMKYTANTELAGKIYRTKVNFSMSGSWNMVVKIVRGGKTAQVKFTVDAR
ncbi:MAG: FixH family protein [Syntrophales bacterium]